MKTEAPLFGQSDPACGIYSPSICSLGVAVKLGSGAASVGGTVALLVDSCTEVLNGNLFFRKFVD